MDVASPLFDEHDPGSRPVVDEDPAPAIEGPDPVPQATPADVSLVEGIEVIPAEDSAPADADKEKGPSTSGPPEVANLIGSLYFCVF